MGVVLESGVRYQKLPPQTRMADLKPGDRLIYHGTTWEVLEEATLSTSGKKYKQRWRIAGITGGWRAHAAQQGLPYASVGHTIDQGGLVKTATNRVVYRPHSFHEYYIEEF